MFKRKKSSRSAEKEKVADKKPDLWYSSSIIDGVAAGAGVAGAPIKIKLTVFPPGSHTPSMTPAGSVYWAPAKGDMGDVAVVTVKDSPTEQLKELVEHPTLGPMIKEVLKVAGDRVAELEKQLQASDPAIVHEEGLDKAPRDRAILAFDPQNGTEGRWVIVQWDVTDNWWSHDGDVEPYHKPEDITHWRELPPKPEGA